MKKLAVILLTLALSGGVMAAHAQTQAIPQAPGQPMMMCPCMMMMQKQMTPEQMKQMQEQMAQWWRSCPMWQTMGPQTQPAPAPEKKK